VEQETDCVVRYAGVVSQGTARLESEDIRFRGEFGLTIPFSDVESVEARDGVLHVGFSAGEADFEIGALADRWAERIRNPRALIDKLDVKPGARVAVLGMVDDGHGTFWSQLRARTEFVLEHSLASDLDVIVLGVERRPDLEQIDALEPYLRRNGCIWIVAPRGQPHLTELDVLTAGRAAGLYDVKVARFSDTHTAHKFVIPRTRR
jgi:hypothetical protein